MRDTTREALERLVAELETNSELGAPDYAFEALSATSKRELIREVGQESWISIVCRETRCFWSWPFGHVWNSQAGIGSKHCVMCGTWRAW